MRATVPVYMDPIDRFCRGDGELHDEAGRAFNVWDALASFGEAAFPIVIGNRRIEYDTLLARAGAVMCPHPMSPYSQYADHAAVEKVRRLCEAAGFEMPGMPDTRPVEPYSPPGDASAVARVPAEAPRFVLQVPHDFAALLETAKGIGQRAGAESPDNNLCGVAMLVFDAKQPFAK